MRRLIALLAVATLVLTACGGGARETDPSTPSSPAAEESSARNLSDDARAVIVEASTRSQAMDTMRGSMNLQFGIGGQSTSITADMAFEAPGSMHMRMAVPGNDVEVLLVLPDVFVKLGDGEWRQMSDDSLPGINLEQLRRYMEDRGAIDMEALATNLEQLERTGDVTIDGAEYAHYTGTVDYAALSSQGPAGLIEPAALELLNESVDDVSVEYWIDEATGLPRRCSMAFEMEVPGQPTSSIAMTMDFEEWGGPVDIPEAPVSAPPLDTPET